jgi:hypothetical protein
MDELDESKRVGTFTLAPGKEIYGELTLSGSKTSLYLRDKDPFSTHSNHFINGVLHDLTKISLIRCITTSGPGHSFRGSEKYYFTTIFPHFVVYGDSHIAPHDKTIAKIRFAVDDATALFYDFDAFGFLVDARPFIEKIANANNLRREIKTGPDPQILYFTGKKEIFAAETLIGRVSASHNPVPMNWGGPKGVGLKNTIFVTIEFKEPVEFEESILHTNTLIRYLGMLVGRPQNLIGLDISIKSDQPTPIILQVYWSMSPNREPSHEGERPHPSDVLLDAVRQPEDFSRVLANWLDRQQAWSDARFRFFNSFALQNHYDIERLIGCANMFDILPSSAVPSDMQLSVELRSAKEGGRNIFLPLSRGPERDSILSALGRIGKSSLKQKVRHRASKIIDVVSERFPELLTVADEAVNCRNYYVHGGERPFNYNEHFDAVSFFTETLEFIFAASDLIEAGWDIKTWANVPTSMSHPFARFRANYPLCLHELEILLRESRERE